MADQRLGQVHHLSVGNVSLIQLEHGEFGVVPGGHALVAEIAVDLVDALEAADHQALQVQLRRHAQEQVKVERVMVRGERLGRGTACDVMHHRRLDFEEAPCIQPAPHRSDDARTRDEDLARFGCHDEIDIALAVTLLDIGQAMELVRQRPQRLGQQAQPFDLDRQLAGLGAHQGAFGGEDVADVPAFERIVGVAQRGRLQEQLDVAADITQLGERGLAHEALGQHASGDADAAAIALQRLAGPLLRILVIALQVAGVIGPTEIIGESVALTAQRGQLAAAFGDQAVLVLCGRVGLVHRHSINGSCRRAWNRHPVRTSGWPRRTRPGRHRAPSGYRCAPHRCAGP